MITTEHPLVRSYLVRPRGGPCGSAQGRSADRSSTGSRSTPVPRSPRSRRRRSPTCATCWLGWVIPRRSPPMPVHALARGGSGPEKLTAGAALVRCNHRRLRSASWCPPRRSDPSSSSLPPVPVIALVAIALGLRHWLRGRDREHERVTTPAPTLDEVEAFLSELHGSAVHNIEALRGGYWSSAFAYRVGDRELVLRLGTVPEGFEMDHAAMRFDGPDLPVPEVLDIGGKLGANCTPISVRHGGRFLRRCDLTKPGRLVRR